MYRFLTMFFFVFFPLFARVNDNQILYKIERQIKLLILSMLILFKFSLAQTSHNVPFDYPTIQSALNVASSGDTVFVEEGLYHDPIIWPNKNGIKLISNGDIENTILDFDNLQYGLVISIDTTIANIDTTTIIDGFRIITSSGSNSTPGIIISNASPKIKNIKMNYSALGQKGLIDINNSKGLFENINVQGTTEYSPTINIMASKIKFYSLIIERAGTIRNAVKINSSSVEFINSKIQNISSRISSNPEGITANGAFITLRNCIISEVSGNGIQLGLSRGFLLENSEISNCQNGIESEDDFSNDYNEISNYINNCKIYNNGAGILLDNTSVKI